MSPLGDPMRSRRAPRAVALVCLLVTVTVVVGPLASKAQDGGKGSPGAPSSRELQEALTAATERFQAMDRAGVLSYVSDRYRGGSLTKPAIAEQLRVMFTLYDTVRAKVRIDEVRPQGELVWVYSSGEVSGRLRGLGTWMEVLSWTREPEVLRKEQGAWRLYGDQQ